MAHYAKVLNNQVVDVIVADETFMENFVDNSPGEWVQTSYNTVGGVHYNEDLTPSNDQSKALRKNFAGVGYTYDSERDAFIPPKPYESWSLDEQSCLWKPPVPRPDNNSFHGWNEENQSWEEVNGN
jgi:hypothetical protein